VTWCAFLETIGQEAPLAMRTVVWERSIDRAVIHFLRDRGILQPGPRAEWNEDCPRVNTACPARIIPTIGAKPKPFQAVPPEHHRCCLPTYLSEQEVATLEFDVGAFITLVRDTLALTGAPKLDASLLSDGALYPIGQQRGRTVLYAPSLSNWAVVDRMRLMRERGPRALVLTPARSDFAMPDVEYEFGSGERLELRFLQDLLSWDEDTHRVVAAKAAFTGEGKAAYARALTYQGLVDLDEAGYRTFLESRNEYHFFLDMVSTIKGKHPVLGLGTDREGLCTPLEAAILAELVEAKEPKEAASLDAFGTTTRSAPEKIVEKARRIVDVTGGARNDWTLFKTHRPLRGRRCYHFAPPAEIRFAVLVPSRR